MAALRHRRRQLRGGDLVRSGATFRPTRDDVGHTLRVAVFATNATGGSAPALSAPSAVENVPENVTLPSVKRDPVRGVKVGATKGRWTKLGGAGSIGAFDVNGGDLTCAVSAPGLPGHAATDLTMYR